MRVGDGRENQEKQFARHREDQALPADSSGTTSAGALCECDGKPIATAAATAINANRPPG